MEERGQRTERAAATAEEIRRRLPEERTIYELAELFKMFGDPTRAKILGCLQIRDLYVGELAEVLGMSDRIAVMYEGRMVGEVERAEASQEKILNMASNIVEENREEAK